MLKPVDDTRMYEKMGLSLASEGQYEVHIIGYRGNQQDERLTFHPLIPFKRLELKRLLVPWLILKKALSINPSIFIITTHELLYCGVLLKALRGSLLVYDVQENYYRNIRYLPSFPRYIRQIIARYVRIKEHFFAPWVNLFLLSDRGYKDELPFIGKKSVAIENKVREETINRNTIRHKSDQTHLLFSGTLAISTGVFMAIDLAVSLHQIDDRIKLKIIGYCAQPEILHRIRQNISNKTFITLSGGDELVPHKDVMEAIAESDFGIIAYQPSPATENTTPTKLFEYLGARLPILSIYHAEWIRLCSQYHAAITFDPSNPQPAELLKKMKETDFYIHPPGPEVFWENEAKTLIKALNSIA